MPPKPHTKFFDAFFQAYSTKANPQFLSSSEEPRHLVPPHEDLVDLAQALRDLVASRKRAHHPLTKLIVSPPLTNSNADRTWFREQVEEYVEYDYEMIHTVCIWGKLKREGAAPQLLDRETLSVYRY